jgi:hypothetical protein
VWLKALVTPAYLRRRANEVRDAEQRVPLHD